MNRREFSAAAACRLGAAGPGPAGRLAPGPGKPRGRQGLPTLDKRVPRRGAGRQDRGGRVLLVQLPALQCLRAAAGSLDQEAAAGRGVPPRAGGLPRRLRAAAAPVLHAGGHGQARRAAQQGVPGHPRRTPADRPRKTRSSPGPRRTAWTRPSSRRCTTRSRCPTKARRATQLQDAYEVDGVPALGIAGRYYTDGDPGRQHGPRPAGHRLPGRRSAQGQVDARRALVAARTEKPAPAGFLLLALGYNAQQDSCLYEHTPSLPCRCSLALALAGRAGRAPKRPTATSR